LKPRPASVTLLSRFFFSAFLQKDFSHRPIPHLASASDLRHVRSRLQPVVAFFCFGVSPPFSCLSVCLFSHSSTQLATPCGRSEDFRALFLFLSSRICLSSGPPNVRPLTAFCEPPLFLFVNTRIPRYGQLGTFSAPVFLLATVHSLGSS